MRGQLQEVIAITDSVERSKKAIDIMSPILRELRSIRNNLDETDEKLIVAVNKHTIPTIYAEYIFYASLHNLHISKPFGNRQKEYFTKQSERIELWFSENETFLRYYRSRQTHLDREYFLSSGNKSTYIDLYSPMLEQSFCSHYSFIAAMGIAYQRLQKEITLLIIASSASFVSTLQWTFSKTDLTELIYALYACGVFNKGKATIKDITKFFEETLHISLGNTSVTFQEILRRKDSAAFLQRLDDALDRYITQVEEKNIR